MARLLFTLRFESASPTVADVCRRLGIRVDQIDESFGVVPIDPRQQLFAVLLDADVASRLLRTDVGGPFSNPQIEPFGPPKK